MASLQSSLDVLLGDVRMYAHYRDLPLGIYSVSGDVNRTVGRKDLEFPSKPGGCRELRQATA